jgi:hypothetical protein
MKSIIKICSALLISLIVIFWMNNEGPDVPIKYVNNLFLGMMFIAVFTTMTVAIIELKSKKSKI